MTSFGLLPILASVLSINCFGIPSPTGPPSIRTSAADSGRLIMSKNSSSERCCSCEAVNTTFAPLKSIEYQLPLPRQGRVGH